MGKQSNLQLKSDPVFADWSGERGTVSTGQTLILSLLWTRVIWLGFDTAGAAITQRKCMRDRDVQDMFGRMAGQREQTWGEQCMDWWAVRYETGKVWMLTEGWGLHAEEQLMQEQWGWEQRRLCLFWWPQECFQASGSVCIPWLPPKPQGARARCSLVNTAAYKYLHPPLGSGFCGKEIQEYGLADKHSTHQPAPSKWQSLSLMAHIARRNKEEGFAQHLSCRFCWYRETVNMFLAGFKGERETLNLVCYYCLWQGFIHEKKHKKLFLQAKGASELVLFVQCPWSDRIIVGSISHVQTALLSTDQRLPQLLPSAFLTQVTLESGLAFCLLFSPLVKGPQ